ncbi:MAG: hypothetical protein RL748_2378, partial [Pseudomonadota bacterium]
MVRVARRFGAKTPWGQMAALEAEPNARLLGRLCGRNTR